MSRETEKENSAHDALRHVIQHNDTSDKYACTIIFHIPIVSVYCVLHRLEEFHDIITFRDLSVYTTWIALSTEDPRLDRHIVNA